MKGAVVFWLGFSLFVALPGLIEAFLIATGRPSISARISPAVQDHAAEAVMVALILGIILGFLAWHFAHYTEAIPGA